jgi:hypothetical protein
MTVRIEYPLFIPPNHLVSKGRAHWNAKEATEYKEWLLGVLDERVAELENRLEEPCGASPADHLMALGRKAVLLLMDAPFSEDAPAGRRLTNLGYALAADMGLLVAKYLLQAFPNRLRWEIIRKPKSEISYNLPVLEGFSFNYLEPVGGSTAEAFAILRGQRGADTWKRIYEFWVEKEITPPNGILRT